MGTDPLLQAFFEESSELLADFEAGLLRLEKSPEDAELLNRIFRSAHTLKGGSSMLGFEEIAHFTHTLEDLLDQLRKGQRTATAAVVDALLDSVDVLRGLLTRAQEGTGAGAPEETETAERVLGRLRALLSDESPSEPPSKPRPVPSAPPAVETLYDIQFDPPPDFLRRGLDPIQILRHLTELGEILHVAADTDKLPPLAGMDPERCYLTWRIRLLSGRPQADIESCFEFVGQPEAVRIDTLLMDAGETSPAPAAPDPVDTERAPEIHSPSPKPPGSEAKVPHSATDSGLPRRRASDREESTSIRVPIDKVDRLINLVGEMVITQSMLAQTVSSFTLAKLPQLQEAVSQMDRHARELHERMMAVRMLPIKTLFARFPRVVRDLAAAAGKQVVLEVSGEETELDKTVIEKISDPLTHLIRNSVDHGIELPEERRTAGKPEAGRVELKAYQQGGNIYVEVVDDGKGLDRERIVAKGVQNGLVAADQVLSDEEAFSLIFRPGLSTAERITEVSGRGVGMDVVKKNVEALNGSITIESGKGQGTRFRIKLPLTLAIMDGQCLQVGEQVYFLPLVAITESVRPARRTIHTVAGRGEVVMVRDKPLPILRLHRLFGLEPKSEDPTQGLVVIFEYEGKLAALLVDELLGQQQVVIKSLESNFKKIEGIAGATILGDGRVALILDVPGLMNLAASCSSAFSYELVAACESADSSGE